MRVLVCGSRSYNDTASVFQVLDGIAAEAEHFGLPFVLIHGAAPGADSIAGVWGSLHPCALYVYPADWTNHGRRAGPIRNQQMLDEGQPDVVWAFVDKPLAESVGTADMVRRARAARLPVYVVEASKP